jgi:UPF0271 protein
MLSIDLNCDCGESYGAWTMGRDAEILPLVSSANIACGFHAGDPTTIRATLELCARNGTAVGAHPAWPDLQGFGRRSLAASAEETYALTLYQISAMAGMARAQGLTLQHVKPHGALYNQAAREPALANAIARAVLDFDPGLILLGLAGSELVRAGESLGVRVAHEVFADRRYEADGSLTPRAHPQALIHDPREAVEQVLDMLLRGRVRCRSGEQIPVQADSVCIHGDASGAVEFVRALREAFARSGIEILSLAERIA